MAYTLKFFEIWPETDPLTSLPYTLRTALDKAAYSGTNRVSHLNDSVIIYGCPDLKFWF